MPFRLTQSSFTRGELTPRLYDRNNLEQYPIGLKTAKNALIHQEGGISNRSGLEFCGEAKYSNKFTRLIKFVFNDEQTYMLEFGDKYIRVLKNGNYVIYPDNYGEDIITENYYDGNFQNLAFHQRLYNQDYITFEIYDSQEEAFVTVYVDITNATVTPDEREPVYHYDLTNCDVYSDIDFEDLIGKISFYDNENMELIIQHEITNTDQEKIAKRGQIVEIETPYNADDLPKIKRSQSGDILTLTHPDYPVKNLSRLSHYDWELENVVLGSVIAPPENVTAVFNSTTPTSNQKTYTYCITAVDEHTNTESERSESADVVAHREANWTTSEYITITCNEVVGASEYNIYRDVNGIMGYVGTAQATEDAIVSYNGAFSNYLIKNKDTVFQLVSATIGQTVIYSKDLFANDVKVYSDTSCKNFYGTIVTFTNTSRTKTIKIVTKGVKFVDDKIEPDLSSSAPVVRNPFEDENNPACSCYFQQRKIFANTKNYPQTIYASQLGTINNFNVSRPLVSTDAITLSMDDREMNEIRHIIPMKDLLVLTSNSEYRVNGTDGVFSASPMPASVIQSCYGSSDVEPVISGSMILFVQAGGSVIRDLGYDIMTEGYDGDELSIFSSHLFEGKRVVSMAYAKEPYRVLYVIFNDGTCASMTYNKKQKLCGWTQIATDGKFEWVDVIREQNEDVPYFVVNRLVNTTFEGKFDFIEQGLNSNNEQYYKYKIRNEYYYTKTPVNKNVIIYTDNLFSDVIGEKEYQSALRVTASSPNITVTNNFDGTHEDSTEILTFKNKLDSVTFNISMYNNSFVLHFVTPAEFNPSATIFSYSGKLNTFALNNGQVDLNDTYYQDFATQLKFSDINAEPNTSYSLKISFAKNGNTTFLQNIYKYENEQYNLIKQISISTEDGRVIAYEQPVITNLSGTIYTNRARFTNSSYYTYSELYGWYDENDTEVSLDAYDIEADGHSIDDTLTLNYTNTVIGLEPIDNIDNNFLSVGGQNLRYIERMYSRLTDTAEDAFMVDCGLKGEFENGITTLSGLSHIENKEVIVNADGNVITGLVVNNGQIILPRAAKKISVGLPYTFEIETLKLEGDNTHGLKKIINYINLSMYKSREDFVYIGTKGSSFRNKRCSESINNPTKLFSKNMRMTVLSDAVSDATVHIKQDYPLPLSILSVSIDADIQDNENK